MSVVEASLLEDLFGFSVAGLTMDAAHEKVNATILRYEKYIRSLKTIRNSLVPISRLPNETLSRILNLSYRSCKSHTPPPLRARLYLTWVCRHWRNVTLGDAQLWRYIDNHSFPSNSCSLAPEHFQACLSRSKSLNIDIDLAYLRSDNAFDLCLPQLHRIRSLAFRPYHQLKKSKVKSTKHFNEHWTDPAPVLSYLKLYDTVLWSKPFNGVHPELKDVELIRCGFNWNWPLSILTLTSLRITFPASLIPADVLLEKLIMLPSLTKLHIRSCLTKMTTAVTTPFIFPSLSRLYVEDGDDLVFGFLEGIETPMISSLQASIHMHSCSEDTLTRALDLFKKLHPSLWNDDFRHLAIRTLSLEVEGSSQDCKDAISFCPRSRTSILPLRSHHLSLDRLEKLSLDIEYNKELFDVIKEQDMASVRSLWIDPHGSAVKFLAEAQKANGSANVFLPSLVEVHCSPGSSLLRFLKQRRKILDRKLPKLTLSEQCNIPVNMEEFADVADVVDVSRIHSVDFLEVDYECEWER